ncbi:hypothetical protein JCM4914_31690 [Streptomyces platensis subsp. malvinus]
MAKGAAHIFLGLKISFINAVAAMCETNGGDVSQIVDLLGFDARIGAEGMRPGIGYGGGCLPKGEALHDARHGRAPRSPRPAWSAACGWRSSGTAGSA